ncbi:MAG: DUF3575 domain-containing protein [Bacteroidaceae bacterium]|nr:DUF3575 domain-containing protein [Bacteroidaceae bacterium]
MYREKTIFQRAILLAIWVFLLEGKVCAQDNFAVRNNFIYDISGTPNLGVDVRVSPHWTLGLNAGYRPWPLDDKTMRKWRHLLIAPELRYWKDSTFHRSYLGANLVYSHYNVGHVTFPFSLYPTVRDYRLQGDLAAIGAFYGRSWRLNRFFRLEAELGLGIGYTWAKKYECIHCGDYLGRHDKVFLIPKLTLNVVYQKIKKKPQEPTIIDIPIKPEAEPVLVFHPVEDNTGKAGVLQQENALLEHISNYRPYDRTRVLLKDKGALFVYFPVGKSDINHDFRGNAEVLDRIVNITRQIMADTTSTVCRIQIVGMASVEGAVARNEKLAGARADALKQYIQERVQMPDSYFEVANGGEAWADFRSQIVELMDNTTNADTIKALQRAIRIIDTENDLNYREVCLRRLAGGSTYAYIKKHLLPDQRNSGYLRIYYDYVPDANAPVINRATELLQQKRYSEALPLLRSVQGDSRSWNALGVALWHTGDHAAAQNYFKIAAQQGNADAKQNLKALTKQ